MPFPAILFVALACQLTTVNGIDLDVICENEATGTILSNPDACTTYFYCHEGTVYDMDCPSGYYFEVLSMSCKPQKFDDIKCGLCYNLLDGDKVKIPGGCSKYGVCKGNLVIEEGECAADEAFDTNEFTCKSNNVVKCDKRCDNATQQFFGDPTDCKNYLHCDHGQVKVYQCPDELFFDSERMLCTYLGDVTCAE